MNKASKIVALITILAFIAFAIGPDALPYFIDTRSIILVLALTWLGITSTFGLEGFATIFKWITGKENNSSEIVRIGKCGAILSVGFGGLGSMIGMVLMLQGLNDPSALGPGMAVASLTAIYGLLQAVVIFTPMMFSSGKVNGDQPINV